ncbi:TolC family protein [Cystobacter fuscus]|uniref:TolC family protein n=1 Tax=Cystobacter fuscus TaxID=43 RepID=UPI002B2EB068|nr:TolC family protein [Cystobacter fuscus]
MPSPLSLTFCLFLQSAPAPHPLTVEESVAIALERSPRLISARAEAASARARLEGASLLAQENPQLQGAVGPRWRQAGERADPSLDVSLGVSQRLELLGQRGARRDAAAAQLAASEARLQALRVTLATEVRGAFARLLAAEQELRLDDEGRLLAEQALRAAEERLTAGAASRIEVNTARVEMGRAAHERVLSVRRRSLALAELRLLLGLEPTETPRLSEDWKPDDAEPPPLEALLERALAQRAEVKAARAELDAARAEVTLASREALPAPRLGASYSREEDAHIVQGTLGIELPLFNRNQEARGLGAARRIRAQAELEATERMVRSEVALALERYQNARAAMAVYGADVLEALQQNLALVNEAYRAGKVDFFQLLVIRRDALDARRGSIDALAELLIAEAQLQSALGGQP